jgi:hypothetical protein
MRERYLYIATVANLEMRRGDRPEGIGEHIVPNIRSRCVYRSCNAAVCAGSFAYPCT